MVVLLAHVAAVGGREARHDRIGCFDSSNIAGAGAMMYTAYGDLESFVSAPMAWVYDYYHQYPAVAVKKYPPIFATFEALVFTVTGVNVLGVKLATIAFVALFAVAFYFALARMTGDNVLACAAVMCALLSPGIISLGLDAWFDFPGWAVAALALCCYSRRVIDGDRRLRTVLLAAGLAALAVYTSPLVLLWLVGLGAHLVTTQRLNVIRDKGLLAAVAMFAVLLAPLVAWMFVMGPEAVRSGAGQVQERYAAWIPESSKTSLLYWTYYARELFVSYPVQAVGVVLWIVSALRRRLQAWEILFAVWLAVTYLVFSWMPSKSTRYAAYIAIVASPLAVEAVRQIGRWLLRQRPALASAATAALVLLLGAAQWMWVETRPFYTTGMRAPVSAIFAVDESPQIVYCGPQESAFVWYVRQADHDRRARVARGGSEVLTADEFSELTGRGAIDFVVLEQLGPVPTAERHVESYRFLSRLAEHNGNYVAFGIYQVAVGKPGSERPVELRMFRNRTAAVASR